MNHDNRHLLPMATPEELALRDEIQQKLHECHDRLSDDTDLRGLIDAEPRLSPWLNDLLDAHPFRSRVLRIRLLHKNKTSDGECALVLFLMVLARQYQSPDATHHELLSLATRLDILTRNHTSALPPTRLPAHTAAASPAALRTAEQRQFDILRILYDHATTYPKQREMPERSFWRELSSSDEMELIEKDLCWLERQSLIGKDPLDRYPDRQFWIRGEGIARFLDQRQSSAQNRFSHVAVKPLPSKLGEFASIHRNCAPFIHREPAMQAMKKYLAHRTAPHTVILLSGQPQTGKTALLDRLKCELNSDYIPIPLDGKLLPRYDPVIFADRLAAMCLSSYVKHCGPSPDKLERPMFDEGLARDSFKAFWQAFCQTIGGLHPVIIIDEFGSLLEQVDCHLSVVEILNDLVDFAQQGQYHLILVISGPLKQAGNPTTESLITTIMKDYKSIQLRHYSDQDTLMIINTLRSYLRFTDTKTWRCLAAQVDGHPRLIDEMLMALATLARNGSMSLQDEREARQRFLSAMVRRTDDLLRSLEQALSDDEHLVISLICQHYHYIDQRPSFLVGELLGHAQRSSGDQLRREQIEGGIRQLQEREWLATRDAASEMYQFKISLFLYWWHQAGLAEVPSRSAIV
jgi:AAA domain